MTSTALYDLATAVLVSSAAALTAPPDRQFVADGDLVIEACEQLAVQVNRVRLGLPGAQKTDSVLPGQAFGRTAELSVYVTRCVPVANDRGDAPTATEIDTSARLILTDGWELFIGLLEAGRAGDFSAFCDKFTIPQLIPIQREGGLGGMVLQIEAQL